MSHYTATGAAGKAAAAQHDPRARLRRLHEVGTGNFPRLVCPQSSGAALCLYFSVCGRQAPRARGSLVVQSEGWLLVRSSVRTVRSHQIARDARELAHCMSAQCQKLERASSDMFAVETAGLIAL
jgi:hypothetical protein